GNPAAAGGRWPGPTARPRPGRATPGTPGGPRHWRHPGAARRGWPRAAPRREGRRDCGLGRHAWTGSWPAPAPRDRPTTARSHVRCRPVAAPRDRRWAAAGRAGWIPGLWSGSCGAPDVNGETAASLRDAAAAKQLGRTLGQRRGRFEELADVIHVAGRGEWRQGVEEGFAIRLLGQARIAQDQDAAIALGADQAADALLERDHRLRQLFVAERVAAGAADRLQPRLEHRVVGRGERQLVDHHHAQRLTGHVHALAEAGRPQQYAVA